MHEGSADQVAGCPVHLLNAALTDASGGKLFQFPECDTGRFLVGLDDAPVVHGDGQDGHRFWRGANEVEVNAPLPKLLRCQLFSSLRVLVITEPEERITSDDFTRF